MSEELTWRESIVMINEKLMNAIFKARPLPALSSIPKSPAIGKESGGVIVAMTPNHNLESHEE